MKQITTIHTKIGYSDNVQVIERALREHFGFNDNSFMLTAVAAHIWGHICGSQEEQITWGKAQIYRAIGACQVRLEKMLAALRHD